MTQSDYLNSQDPDLPDPFEVELQEPEALPPPATSLADLASRLFLPLDFLEEIWWLLEDKRSIILAGPPGTGKTYVAREIARYLAPNRTSFVQFHPSYSYEDFVAGYRPTDLEGALTYRILEGPLLDAVSAASSETQDDPTYGKAPHVLLIDEINRANLAKVFGELMFAIEYRDQPVRLQYQEHGLSDMRELSIPRNLLFLGTMNTADRSIASFDSALRRRFHFVDFHPMKSPIEDVLRRYLETHGRSDLMWIPDAVQRNNNDLPDPAFAIGPSHFMGRPHMTDSDVQRRWRHSVIPFLEGRFGSDFTAQRQTLTAVPAGSAVVAPSEGDPADQFFQDSD
jgi:5-methylcytosine-specific restriction protein B